MAASDDLYVSIFVSQSDQQIHSYYHYVYVLVMKVTVLHRYKKIY